MVELCTKSIAQYYWNEWLGTTFTEYLPVWPATEDVFLHCSPSVPLPFNSNPQFPSSWPLYLVQSELPAASGWWRADAM